MTSTTVSVSVTVDPATAFRAFTEELDLWRVRGPINYFDSGRSACSAILESGQGWWRSTTMRRAPALSLPA
jgi:hypothetical protein